MGNKIQLKDNSNNKAYPLTKTDAVYTDNANTLKDYLDTLLAAITLSPTEKEVTGNPIEVTDAIAGNAKGVVLKVEPHQEGTGDPSPDNVRPITGYDSLAIEREDSEGTTQSFPITIPTEAGTIYGATIDPVNGTMSVNTIKIAVSPDTKATYANGFTNGTNANRFGFAIAETFLPIQNSTSDIICNIGYGSNNANSSNTNKFIIGACSVYKGTNCMYFRYCVPTSITTAEDAYQYLQDNNCEFTAPLETPITYTLTPQQIALLSGVNNISMTADGTIELTYDADTKKILENM